MTASSTITSHRPSGCNLIGLPRFSVSRSSLEPVRKPGNRYPRPALLAKRWFGQIGGQI